MVVTGSQPPDGCAVFVAARYPAMLRSAFLLCGSQTDAEDLAQDALVRVVQRWGRVSRSDDPVAYANRILLNTFLSGRRRRWHGEVAHAAPPERPDAAGGYGAVDDRDALRRALMGLPPRQRAAVVLRHHQQLSEADAAALLGCSVGTVKSLTSRGLAALRANTGPLLPAGEEKP
jgi:RNA polymerase sigma-70 factor (sigma-E family)